MPARGTQSPNRRTQVRQEQCQRAVADACARSPPWAGTRHSLRRGRGPAAKAVEPGDVAPKHGGGGRHAPFRKRKSSLLGHSASGASSSRAAFTRLSAASFISRTAVPAPNRRDEVRAQGACEARSCRRLAKVARPLQHLAQPCCRGGAASLDFPRLHNAFQKRRIIELALAANPSIDTAVRTHRASEVAYLKEGRRSAIMGTREVAFGLPRYALFSFGLSEDRHRGASSFWYPSTKSSHVP